MDSIIFIIISTPTGTHNIGDSNITVLPSFFKDDCDDWACFKVSKHGAWLWARYIEKIGVVQLTMPSAMLTTKWELMRDQANIRVDTASSANALNTTERSILQLSGPQLVKISPNIQRTRTYILMSSGKPATVYFQPPQSITQTHTHTHTQYIFIYIYIYTHILYIYKYNFPHSCLAC